MKKSIYQINKNQIISISCYQYSPESFKAYIKTTGLNPNIPAYEEIKITNAGELGYQYITGKKEEVIKQLKQQIRKESQKTKQFTYGFKTKDSSQYGWILGYPIKQNASLKERYSIFKKIKEVFESMNWMQKSHTLAELGAGYKTKKVEDIYTIFDKTSPVKIWEA